MSGRVRLLSANLANGRADPDAFGALVEALDPDVVAVQEVHPSQAEVLARLLPFGKLEPAQNHKGMGIALRQPGSVRYVPLRYRGLYVAEVGLDGDHAGVEIVNAHISAPHSPPFRRALARRREQLRGLLAYVDATAGRRRVVVGDLNSTTLWPVYRCLVARFADRRRTRPLTGLPSCGNARVETRADRGRSESAGRGVCRTR